MDHWKGKHCRVDGCNDWASRDIDLLPICGEHAWELAQHYRSILTEQARLEARKLDAKAKDIRAAQRGDGEPSLVYYARIGDYIKIGFSTRLRSRLNSLRVDELMAVEPGGYDLEQMRHVEFDADRIDLRRENFRPSDHLLEHIAAIRTQHDLPHWAKLPRTSAITRRTKETR